MGLNAYTVEAYAFRDCIRLIYVKFSEKATRFTVDADAFENTSCYYASVPAGSDFEQTISTDICHYVKYGSYNDLIEEVNGFYYDKRSNTLIAIDNETSTVVIPEGITALSQKFYIKCKNAIFSIVIPSSVTVIPNFGIQYKNRPFYVNYMTEGKVQVYYTGTEADWEKIDGGMLLKFFDLYYLNSKGETEFVTDEWFEVHHSGEWEYSPDGTATLK